MYYMGLDLSLTGTGIVGVDDACTIIFQEKLSPPSGCMGVDRLYLLSNELDHLLDKYSDIKYACIEGPAYGRGEGGRLFEIGEWTGIVKLALFKRSIPMIIATPLQLKKYVSGQGKGGKELIILDVFKNFHVEIRDNDLADAYVLSRIMHDYHFLLTDHHVELKKHQEDVLNKIIERFTEPSSFLD